MAEPSTEWMGELERWLQGATADVPRYIEGLIGPGDRKNVFPGLYDQLYHLWLTVYGTASPL